MLPSGVPAEMLSGVTHEDCVVFTHDFGTVLDVEDLVPGAEYTLEVSSPGLERKLSLPRDFTRFTGGLVKLQTFTAIDANRHFQGRLTGFADGTLTWICRHQAEGQGTQGRLPRRSWKSRSQTSKKPT